MGTSGVRTNKYLVTIWYDSHTPKSRYLTRTLQNVFADAAAYAFVAKTQHIVCKILEIFQIYTYSKDNWNIGVHISTE